MSLMSTLQPNLIDGFYRCHNCGHDVERVLKTRRFRLCLACYAAIVEPTNPGKNGSLADGSLTEEEYGARAAFWQWYSQMEKRYPIGRNWSKKGVLSLPLAYAGRDYYPFCACGNRKREMTLFAGGITGLFGGPFMDKCPICEAKATVESMFVMREAIFRDKDEEEILDQLLKTFPEIFKLRVLPDYWFELRLDAGL